MKNKIITIIAIILAAAFLFFLMQKPSEPALTVVSFGGAYSKTQKEHMLDPFSEKTAIKILSEDYSGGIAELKTQVESANVTWDVLDIEYIDVERACSEGLLEIIPKQMLADGDDGTPAAQDFNPEAYNGSECAVGNIIWAVIFAYRNDLKNKPHSIKDVFDVNKIPGKRAFRKRPQLNLEWALMADGVPMSEVYQVLSTPSGVKRAFAKLDTIKSHILWFDSWSQAPQLLSDGSAVIVQSANGRIYRAIKDDKQDFSIIWQGNLYDLDGWAIPKGTPNKQKALEFILFSTQTKPLAGMQDVAYGVTRKSAQKYINEAVKPHLPSSHLDKGLKVSSAFWSDNGANLNEKFAAWLIKN